MIAKNNLIFSLYKFSYFVNKYFLIIKEVLLTRSNIEWSAMFLGFALIWMISGTLVTDEEIIETYVEKESTVRVIDQTSQNFTREILIKGFAEADKKVELKAETSGRVIALPISQGSRVKEGDPICSIFMAEKESFFKKAERIAITKSSLLGSILNY